MARSGSIRFSAPLHGLPVLVVCAVLMSPAIATADLNGHWRYDFGFIGLTDVTHVGSSVSFVVTNSIGISASFSGTVTGTSLNAMAPPPTPSDCGLVISATIAPDESSFAGFIATETLCPNPGYAPIGFQRCGCFDGNRRRVPSRCLLRQRDVVRAVLELCRRRLCRRTAHRLSRVHVANPIDLVPARHQPRSE